MNVLVNDGAMKEMLHAVVRIAVSAGDCIMKIYNDPEYGVVIKDNRTPLTEADLAADAVISKGLADLDLGWPVLSEESAQISFEDRSKWQRYWLIDPLDGTKEFIKRNGEFTVNIALIERGMPILGVVYAPALDVCYFAAQNVGSFVKKGNEVACEAKVKPCEGEVPLIVVTSRSHGDARTESLMARLGDCQRVNMGSSLKLCLVASGEAHFYPRLGPTMEWDVAAAHAVVKFSGGRVCDIAGKDLQYNKPDLRNPEFYVLPCESEYLLSCANGL